MPVLGNMAQLRDRYSQIGPDTEFDVRISVKSQRAVWEERNLIVSVEDLLEFIMNECPALAHALLPSDSRRRW